MNHESGPFGALSAQLEKYQETKLFVSASFHVTVMPESLLREWKTA